MKYERTLITGGSGLVGSTIFSEYKPTRQELDLMNIDDIILYIKTNKIDSIIHCAARVGGIKANTEKIGEFFYENIIINTNVLEAARICGVNKVVSVMTTCAFPDDVEYPLTTEQLHNGKPHPSNYGYAHAKRMLDIQSKAYRDQYGCNFVTAIPCNVYGPRDNYNLNDSHVIPALIRKAYEAKQNNTDFEIWGTGKAYREFIYSVDLGELLMWTLENYNDREPLIISPDEEISIATLAQEIAWRIGLSHGKSLVYNQELDGQLRKPSDNSRLKELLPDFQFTPIEYGLEKSIDWFIENHQEARK